VEKNLLKRKNIKNSEDFKKVLKKQGIKYQTIKKKLYVETLWNQLVYQKFKNNIVIDKVGLKKSIQDKFKNKEEKFIYNLSEIVFSESINENADQIFKKINRSIKNIGFENSANIFSISNTNKNGGMIGWINEIQISEQINNEIKNLSVNEITRPIKINNGFILIKVNDKKLFKEQINIDEELSKLVNKETNRQLSTFSSIYYKKLKKNIEINEY
jgi:peptidyl-prolyl cis-trans isomerase SurA